MILNVYYMILSLFFVKYWTCFAILLMMKYYTLIYTQ